MTPVDQYDSNAAWLGAIVDPIVQGTSLNDYIAGVQMDQARFELHVHFTRNYNYIVDGISAVHLCDTTR